MNTQAQNSSAGKHTPRVWNDQIRCFGVDEIGPFAQLDDSTRIRGICARAPELLSQNTALLARVRELEEALNHLMDECQASRKYIVLNSDEGFTAYKSTATAIVKANQALAQSEMQFAIANQE